VIYRFLTIVRDQSLLNFTVVNLGTHEVVRYLCKLYMFSYVVKV